MARSSLRHLKDDSDLEQIEIRYVEHRDMNERESMEHACTVFDQWWKTARPHVPATYQGFGDGVTEAARESGSYMYERLMVDFIADCYRHITDADYTGI